MHSIEPIVSSRSSDLFTVPHTGHLTFSLLIFCVSQLFFPFFMTRKSFPVASLFPAGKSDPQGLYPRRITGHLRIFPNHAIIIHLEQMFSIPKSKNIDMYFLPGRVGETFHCCPKDCSRKGVGHDRHLISKNIFK